METIHVVIIAIVVAAVGVLLGYLIKKEKSCPPLDWTDDQKGMLGAMLNTRRKYANILIQCIVQNISNITRFDKFNSLAPSLKELLIETFVNYCATTLDQSLVLRIINQLSTPGKITLPLKNARCIFERLKVAYPTNYEYMDIVYNIKQVASDKTNTRYYETVIGIIGSCYKY